MQRPSHFWFHTYRIAFCVGLVLLGLLSLDRFLNLSYGAAQSDRPQSRLEIASVDTSQFPDVGVNLIATDPQSRPLRELQGLRLRENGVPVADFDVLPFTAGIDLFLVVDANSRIQDVEDASGVTRLQKVKDSILAYAGRFMDLAGRDHVTVIVPGGDGPAPSGRLLVEDITEPDALIEAVRPYDPGRSPPASPVIEMLELALEMAASVKEAASTKQAGRFQAIVLYTDAAGFNESRFEQLIERSQALQVPILVLLLGPGETLNENAVRIATALSAPTRGLFAPMATASDSSDLFQVIADNGVQSQLRYASNITRSGSYSLTVALENRSDETTLELQLEPPHAALQLPERTIRRSGTQPDTPLSDLQPAVQPIVAELSWPDGLPRGLQGASLLANGRAQQAPFTGSSERLQFDWGIQDLAAGSYELTVLVTDTLGLASQSEVEVVIIEVVRPEPLPTPRPTATAEPLQALREILPPPPSRAALEAYRPYLAPAGGALLILVLGALAIGRWRRGRRAEPVAPTPPDFDDDTEDWSGGSRPVGSQRATGSTTGIVMAYLDAVHESSLAGGTIALMGNNVTIGSDEAHTDIRLEDRSISALHARIRRRGAEFWLYDEGSQHGTLLNYERLGLAPRLLKDGDEIQFGRVRMHFRLEQSEREAVQHVGREGDD